MKAIQLFVVLTLISGCTRQNAAAANGGAADTSKIRTMATAQTKTYLALGDSYTIGESVPQDQSFPYQLKESLKVKDSVFIQDPKIIAVTGWTTDDLIAAISQSDIYHNTYDYVSLLIGVNDQFQGLSLVNYRAKFARLLHAAIKFAKSDATRVFVVSIPDWGVTPFADGKDGIIGPEIDQFNAINKEESTKAGVEYVTITDISRLAGNDSTLVASDGLHPSGKMYGQWVTRLEPLVAARLKR